MQCTNCGASLTAEQLSQPDCPYCGTALPLQVRAAEKAAVVQQLLQDRDGDGIPDVFEGMMGGAGVGAPAQVMKTSSGANVTVQRVASEVVIVNGVVQQGGMPGMPTALPVPPPTQTAAPTPRKTGLNPLLIVLLPIGLVVLSVLVGLLLWLLA